MWSCTLHSPFLSLALRVIASLTAWLVGVIQVAHTNNDRNTLGPVNFELGCHSFSRGLGFRAVQESGAVNGGRVPLP